MSQRPSFDIIGEFLYHVDLIIYSINVGFKRNVIHSLHLNP